MANKSLISFIVTFAVLFSIAAALPAEAASESWENVFTENFEDSSWEDNFTEVDSGVRTVPAQVDYTNNIGAELGTIKRIASRTGMLYLYAL